MQPTMHVNVNIKDQDNIFIIFFFKEIVQTWDECYNRNERFASAVM